MCVCVCANCDHDSRPASATDGNFMRPDIILLFHQPIMDVGLRIKLGDFDDGARLFLCLLDIAISPLQE